MVSDIAYLQSPLKDHYDCTTPTSSTQFLEDCDMQAFFEIQPEGHIVYQIPGHPKQSFIAGEHWPPIFKPENIQTVKDMIPRDDDVYVCTYPKCGTTWIQHICAQLMNKEYGPKAGNELSATSPMIDRMGAKYADRLPSPRLLKTHFGWYNMPKSSKAKYIYCVRNPKDCLTSYYFHNQNFKIYNFEFGKFDDFFEWFMSGNVAFGSYYRHLLSWLPHINDENVLFLRYEDMWADLKTAIKKIGYFLGGKAAEKVENEEELERIVSESKIDSMKKNQARWFPADNLRGKPFIRKGGSRDWKNYFTKEQSDRMDKEWYHHVTGTIAEQWWKAEMDWNEDEFEIDDEILDDYYGSSSFSSTDDIDFTSSDLEPLRSSLSQPISIPSSRHHLSSISEESGYGSYDEQFVKAW